MASNYFSTGQVVYLRSGSPSMTVRSWHDDGSTSVTWLDVEGHAQFNRFPSECLVLADGAVAQAEGGTS